MIFAFYAGFSIDSLLLKSYSYFIFTELLITILLYKAADKTINTPDLIYNYGFGKYENLAVVITFILLAIIFAHTCAAAVSDIINNRIINSYGINLISFIGIFILTMLKSFLFKRFYNNSGISIFKDFISIKKMAPIEAILLLSAFVQYILSYNELSKLSLYIDSLSAMGLIAFLLAMPSSKIRNSLNQLLDRTLPEETLFDFLSVIIEHYSQFCEYRSMKSRSSGNDIFIEIEVIMHADSTLSDVYNLEKSIKTALKEKYPNIYPKLYAIPCVKNCIYSQKGTCPVLKSAQQAKEERNG